VKKRAPRQVEAPAVARIADLDGAIAAPFGHHLAQTHGFAQFLVQAPAILAGPRAPWIARPLGFFAHERRSLAKEPDDRHGKNIISGRL
jgi:hypothetical protein